MPTTDGPASTRQVFSSSPSELRDKFDPALILISITRANLLPVVVNSECHISEQILLLKFALVTDQMAIYTSWHLFSLARFPGSYTFPAIEIIHAPAGARECRIAFAQLQKIQRKHICALIEHYNAITIPGSHDEQLVTRWRSRQRWKNEGRCKRQGRFR